MPMYVLYKEYHTRSLHCIGPISQALNAILHRRILGGACSAWASLPACLCSAVMHCNRSSSPASLTSFLFPCVNHLLFSLFPPSNPSLTPHIPPLWHTCALHFPPFFGLTFSCNRSQFHQLSFHTALSPLLPVKIYATRSV